jgi:hypothetical protein
MVSGCALAFAEVPDHDALTSALAGIGMEFAISTHGAIATARCWVTAIGRRLRTSSVR